MVEWNSGNNARKTKRRTPDTQTHTHSYTHIYIAQLARVLTTSIIVPTLIVGAGGVIYVMNSHKFSFSILGGVIS